ELPAWGFYVRYADGITFENVLLTASEKDYRPAVVIQESSNIQMKTVEFSEPGKNEKQLHTYRSSDVKITPRHDQYATDDLYFSARGGDDTPGSERLRGPVVWN